MSRPSLDRRSFIKASTAAVGAGALGARGPRRAPAVHGRLVDPVVVSSANGHPACTSRVMEQLLAGKPVVDAVVAGVNLVEDDAGDHSVGLGGLPNEAGVVELDASVMDGATANSGAVAALQRIKNPSLVAIKVMRHTDHCLLVGEGALRFAKAHGFKEEELLTDKAREIWLYWKSKLSDRDDWFAKPLSELPEDVRGFVRHFGTINCSAVDAAGNLAGTTTTSGLAFKIPGRVGDSPIIGAGLYVDNDAGAAGSTGRGEANIVSCASAMVVESMRGGSHPKDACLEACRRIVRMTRMDHLLREDGRPGFNVRFYAVDKKGRHGGGAIWAGGRFAVHDKDGPRLVDQDGLYEG